MMTDQELNPFEQLLPEDVTSLAGDIRIDFSAAGEAIVVQNREHSVFEQPEDGRAYSLRILREA